MILHLSAFEADIDPVILSRGQNYFSRGSVTLISSGTDGSVHASVLGTEKYHVELHVESDVVTCFTCSCPYDFGPVCKHVAAVLYEISSNEQKKPLSRLKEILTGLTKEECIGIILEAAGHDNTLYCQLTAEYTKSSLSQRISDYQSALESGLEEFQDRYGYIDYWHSAKAGMFCQRFLDQALLEMTDKEYEHSFAVLAALLVTVKDAMENSDDSSGSLGGIITSSCDLLKKLAMKDDLTEDIKDNILDFVSDQEFLRSMSDYGWEWDYLGIGAYLVRSTVDRNILLEAGASLAHGEQDTWSSGYAHEQLALLELKLLELYGSLSEIEKYLEEHTGYPAIRSKVLEQYFIRGEYTKLIITAQEGIQQHVEKAPGLVIQWYTWMFRGAEQAEDIPVMREASEYLFLHGEDIIYYHQLKALFGKEEWTDKKNILLEKLHASLHNLQFYHRVLIEEGMIDELWESVMKTPTLEMIERYESNFASSHSIRLADVYLDIIPRRLETFTDRNFYARISGILSRLEMYGEGEKVEETVRILMKRYYNRPALKDELSKHGLLPNQG